MRYPNVQTIDVGIGPDWATYDPANGCVYVTNEYSLNVSVIRGTTIVGTVSVGEEPVASAYSSANGYVYVVNEGSNNVTVINGTKVVGTVAVGKEPQVVVADPSNGFVYVPNAQSNNLSVILGTRVLASVTVGTFPLWATYDEANGHVYVSNYASNNVSAINGTTVVGTVTVGKEPLFSTYDSGNGYVYISNLNPGAPSNVSVIKGTKGVGSVGVGYAPGPMAYDSGNGFVYVTGPSNVSVINGTELVGSVGVAGTPYTATYDPGNGSVYVTNSGGTNVSVISGTLLVGSITVGPSPDFATYDDANSSLYVMNGGGNTVSVISTWFPVTLTESGLPTGDRWWINVTGGAAAVSNNSSLSFEEPNGNYSFSVTSSDRTYSCPGGSFSVSNAGTSESIVCSRVTYLVSFTETGLPAGTNWSVTLGGVALRSTESSVTFPEPNGTYAYEVGALPGWTTQLYNSSIVVDGSAASRSVAWTQVTYPVTFAEVGLVGAGWWVNVTGGLPTFSDSASISINEPNGSFSYSVSALNRSYASPGGSFRVNGASALVRVSFSLLTHTVTFTEEGLPIGTAWSVALVGVSTPSTTGTAIFTKPNGTFSFSIGPVLGYTPNPSSGTITVSGGNVTQEIIFTAVPPTTYTVTFTESGLPSGSVWSVTFNGVPESGEGALPFPGIANGTYSFTIPPVTGYEATPSSGLVAVSGPPPAVSIAFKAAAAGNGNGSGTFLGLPAMEGYAVLGGIIVALALAAAIAVLLSQRKKAPPAPANAPADPPSSP
jgi:YVTN family beta-propeller protein